MVGKRFLSIILIFSRNWSYFEELHDTKLATVVLCRDKSTVYTIKASTLVKSTPPRITLSENVFKSSWVGEITLSKSKTSITG